MFTIAYIGNGKSANRYHIPYVLARSEMRIKSIYPARSLGWKRIDGVTYTDDLDRVLSDDEINLVVICTPPKTHFELASRALTAGRNVLLEKPFTASYEEARTLFDLAEERGLHLQAYQNRRYDSDFLTVCRVIREGRLGELTEMVETFDYWRPSTVLRSQAVERCDTLYYGHVAHTMDQAISLFGTPDVVHYDVRSTCGPEHMNDYYDIDMMYGNLKVSLKSSYFRAHRRSAFCVYGRAGAFVKRTGDRQEEHLKEFYLPGRPGFGEDRPEHYGMLYKRDAEGLELSESVPSEVGDYGRVYDDVRASIECGAPAVVTREQTLLLMRLMEEGARQTGLF